MKKILIFLSLLGWISGYAQTILYGRVIDDKTKIGLPYVNIGIPETSIGTVSDEHGFFNLHLNKSIHSSDSIRFSFIGYNSRMIIISSLSKNKNQIVLTQNINELQAVVFSNEKPKHKILGRDHKGTGTTWYNFYTANEKANDKLSKEAGMKFNINNNCRINSLHFYIGQNEYSVVRFRLNFYNLKNGLPHKLLNKKNIIFEVNDVNSDWFNVDLSSYNIYLKEKLDAIAVTIQWLESKKKEATSKSFSIPFGFSPFDIMYSREKGMANWTTNNINMSFYLDVDAY